MKDEEREEVRWRKGSELEVRKKKTRKKKVNSKQKSKEYTNNFTFKRFLNYCFIFFFTDINECDDSSKCAHLSECKNSPGSFTCKCQDGFIGDGVFCERK